MPNMVSIDVTEIPGPQFVQLNSHGRRWQLLSALLGISRPGLQESKIENIVHSDLHPESRETKQCAQAFGPNVHHFCSRFSLAPRFRLANPIIGLDEPMFPFLRGTPREIPFLGASFDVSTGGISDFLAQPSIASFRCSLVITR